MTYSVIEEIYLGKRGQGELVKQSKEKLRLDEECLKLYDDLRSILNEEQKQKLERLLDKEIQSVAECNLTYYKEGLKIGLLLFSECMQD